MIIKQIPKSMSLNAYRNCHYFKINDQKKKFIEVLEGVMKLQGIEIRPLKTPIKTIFRFYNFRNRDIDGEIVSTKNFHDALIHLEMIPDDNRDYITEVRLIAEEGRGHFFDVEIIES